MNILPRGLVAAFPPVSSVAEGTAGVTVQEVWPDVPPSHVPIGGVSAELATEQKLHRVEDT